MTNQSAPVEAAPRLRPPPEQRFAGNQHQLDLNAIAARLKAQSNGREPGHFQETLYHDGPATIALFVFEKDAGLREHQAHGLVSIQPLTGHIRVQAEGQTHALRPGNILMLKPDVRHDVQAIEESQMLLTVHMK